MAKVKCEVWVAVNEDGDFVVVQDESEALPTLQENVGGYAARVVKITAMIEPPVVAETTIDVPDELGKTVEQVHAE